MKKKETYDLIVSLGYSCQTSNGYICLYGVEPISLVFTWVGIYSHLKLIEYFNNPNAICTKGLSLTINHERKEIGYYDNLFGFYYHSLLKYDKYMSMSSEEKERDVSDVISRIKYLSKKTINLLNSDTKILFWCNHKFDAMNSVEAITTCDRVYEAVLNRTKNKNSNIIFFVNDNEYKLLEHYKKSRQYKIHNVKKFAPRDNALLINCKAYADALKTIEIKNLKMTKANVNTYKTKYLGKKSLKTIFIRKAHCLYRFYKK